MKDSPILFSGPMVKAILEGRKTQTRRPLKKQPLDIIPMKIPNAWATLMTRDPNHGMVIRCRYGVPGDRLWVKETWVLAGTHYMYRADGELDDDTIELGYATKWKPSIFMPRRASRLTLEITAIRAERLQAISEADAIAEGVTLPPHTVTMYDGIYRHAYASLWDSINLKRGLGWATNPWVWVIEFRKV